VRLAALAGDLPASGAIEQGESRRCFCVIGLLVYLFASTRATPVCKGNATLGFKQAERTRRILGGRWRRVVDA
jgi:hypothetical protein